MNLYDSDQQIEMLLFLGSKRGHAWEKKQITVFALQKTHSEKWLQQARQLRHRGIQKQPNATPRTIKHDKEPIVLSQDNPNTQHINKNALRARRRNALAAHWDADVTAVARHTSTNGGGLACGARRHAPVHIHLGLNRHHTDAAAGRAAAKVRTHHQRIGAGRARNSTASVVGLGRDRNLFIGALHAVKLRARHTRRGPVC